MRHDTTRHSAAQGAAGRPTGASRGAEARHAPAERHSAALGATARPAGADRGAEARQDAAGRHSAAQGAAGRPAGATPPPTPARPGAGGLFGMTPLPRLTATAPRRPPSAFKVEPASSGKIRAFLANALGAASLFTILVAALWVAA